MELRDIVKLLRTHWAALVVLTLLGGAVGMGVSARTAPTYTATTTVYVSAQAGASVTDLNQGASYIARQMTSYAEVARSPWVLEPVIERLGLDDRASSLRGDVRADVRGGDTQLISVEVTRGDPDEAAVIADEVAAELSTAISTLSPAREDGSPSVVVTVVSPAVAPSSPTAPNEQRNLALGLAAGLVLGLGWAGLRSTLDPRVRTLDDVRRVVDLPVLATVTRSRRRLARRESVVARPLTTRAEEFRQLRTNLRFFDATRRPRTIVITSARAGEGKSLAAVNLAAALAESGVRVCLVDADLRHPSVARYLRIDGSLGLTSVLIGEAALPEVLQPVGTDGLQVVASGPTAPNPSDLLGSDAMARVIDELLMDFDVVVLDCAPVLPVTDAIVLSTLTDGILLTVGVGLVHREQLREALDRLRTIDARVLGLVVNRLRPRADAKIAHGYTPRPVRRPGVRVGSAADVAAVAGFAGAGDGLLAGPGGDGAGTGAPARTPRPRDVDDAGDPAGGVPPTDPARDHDPGRTGTGRTDAEQTATEHTVAEQTGAEQTGAEQTATERTVPERTTAGRTAPEPATSPDAPSSDPNGTAPDAEAHVSAPRGRRRAASTVPLAAVSWGDGPTDDTSA